MLLAVGTAVVALGLPLVVVGAELLLPIGLFAVGCTVLMLITPANGDLLKRVEWALPVRGRWARQFLWTLFLVMIVLVPWLLGPRIR